MREIYPPGIFYMYLYNYMSVYLSEHLYVLDFHMTPSGVIIHECKQTAKNLSRKKNEIRKR